MEIQSNKRVTRAFNLLKYTFIAVPIIAGADKFTNLLTQWKKYLNPEIASRLPFSDSTFMMMVGVIEIIAGIIVLKKTEIGAYIVAAWLSLIALTLLAGFNLAGFHYVDVAVRDLVMAVAALAVARLSKVVQ
ncbi:MAG: hypothetical protein JST69_06890 [Bacteroidetes bacterium]|nr:hypothetical protein [Bacteroidota bacterium]